MPQPATDNALSGRALAKARRSQRAAQGKAGGNLAGRAAAPASATGREAAKARRAVQTAGGQWSGPVSAAGRGAAARAAPEGRTAEPATPPAALRPEEGQQQYARIEGRAARTSIPAGRRLAAARRQALASQGRSAVMQRDRTRATAGATMSAPAAVSKSCQCGCRGGGQGQEASQDAGKEAPAPLPRGRERRAPAGLRTTKRTLSLMSEGRQFSLARRRALASRGKTAAYQQDRSRSPAEQARQIDPGLSGRELAKEVRAERSRNGGRRRSKSAPCGRVRQKPQAASQDAPWKVGVGETGHGQAVTGTQVGRSVRVTGDEPSTCRPITGTEYLGADIFRTFCQAEVVPNPRKVGLTRTVQGRAITGVDVGRRASVTGNEPGTCQRVTGTEYVSAEQAASYCGTEGVAGAQKVNRFQTSGGQVVTGTSVGRSQRVTGDEVGAARQLTGTEYSSGGNGSAPPKVARTSTLTGSGVTGTRVGRSTRVTGDEPGSCRAITGDEYTSFEDYQTFCHDVPQPEPPKVGVSHTARTQRVTGTLTGRGLAVTGDEPGTCKAITGTPYAGLEQYQRYCDENAQALSKARTRRPPRALGAALTGQQPGVDSHLTGAERGACQWLTGTPYFGAAQYAEVCPAEPASPGSADFPQILEPAPWAAFSVSSPAREALRKQQRYGVTGSLYEEGQITGPFGMGQGKVTGTEQFRFGGGSSTYSLVDEVPAAASIPPPEEPSTSAESSPKPRITGEGMTQRLRITGDDWDRGERITGTEGTSAIGRNPTRRGGPMSAMPSGLPHKRNVSLTEPPARISGSSGSTERGALVTLSGGARG